MSFANTTLPPMPTDLREKLAQLMMVRIGSNLPPIQTAADDEKRVATLLDEVPVGGLVLFNGGASAKDVLARLQQRVHVPLLIGSDIERGVGQQVKGFPTFPHAMAFERLGNEAVGSVSEYVRHLAQDSHEVGIHIAFGPVADVNTNPRNPIIATRAYAETPQRAAELVAAYIRSAESSGLLTTAKHFPGHGDTHQDSHDSLPSVNRTLEQLVANELVPFRSAIEAGCSLVMTAHVSFPQIDASGAPATLSRALLHDVLRDELGFQGVVCSDSLLMAGVRDRFNTEGEMALEALNAGVDLLLDIRDPLEVMEFLATSIEQKKLDESRVEIALQRVWSLKQKVFGVPPTESAGNRYGYTHASSTELAERVARRAIHILRDEGANPLPLAADLPLVAVLLKPFNTPLDPPEQPLAAALRDRFQAVEYFEISPQTSPDQLKKVEQAALHASQLLVAMIVKPAAWHVFGLLPQQKEFVERLSKARSLVLASLGVPYIFDEYPDAKTCVCTYSDVPVSQKALADYMLNLTG